ncbi:hypothetical protein SERLA73DRAFT_50095 [Serpula lacrymans var. lacrymans S7.3]|uniref:Urease accessory protein UreF n=1 Tax=Serpula lacrymans var. lacrymans (strain S7.3) TaxID=936435 RepID=F8PPD3_SERL3|nr:hypothetical protein SERLA73DRAFT_50095 [Serpula lacrymans var. lacrymans S7.3]
MNSDDETYILLLLSDSNLPTGSFVASSGYESYVKHGFLSSASASDDTLNFVQDSLGTYARSSLPFVSDAHRVVADHCSIESGPSEETLKLALSQLLALDEYYETMTLNHVARRASKSQGVALLTLYSKGFSLPRHMSRSPLLERERRSASIVDRLKLSIRREDTHGHLPVCWGVLTGALGLTLERAQYLYLFLHARSLLSAAVRLNTIGPYGSQQLLLHAVRPFVDIEADRCKDLRTGVIDHTLENVIPDQNQASIVDGPAATWPLGEILAVRHDLQHSRIFNS